MKITETENEELLLSISDSEGLAKIEIELPDNICDYIWNKVNEIKGDWKWNPIGPGEKLPKMYEDVDITIELESKAFGKSRSAVQAYIGPSLNWVYINGIGQTCTIDEKSDVRPVAWSRKKRPYAG